MFLFGVGKTGYIKRWQGRMGLCCLLLMEHKSGKATGAETGPSENYRAAVYCYCAVLVTVLRRDDDFGRGVIVFGGGCDWWQGFGGA